MNTYANYATNPRRMRTSKMIGLKVSCNEHLQKSPGGERLLLPSSHQRRELNAATIRFGRCIRSARMASCGNLKIEEPLRNSYGAKMRTLRQDAALRQRYQPRQQHTAAALESQSAPGTRPGEWRAQTVARVHSLRSRGTREKGRLRSACNSLRFPARMPEGSKYV